MTAKETGIVIEKKSDIGRRIDPGTERGKSPGKERDPENETGIDREKELEKDPETDPRTTDDGARVARTDLPGRNAREDHEIDPEVLVWIVDENTVIAGRGAAREIRPVSTDRDLLTSVSKMYIIR